VKASTQADALPDHDGMLGHDLDRAVVLDVHDAAADRLAVGKVDEEVVAWSPTGLGLVHVDQDAPARWPGLEPTVMPQTCHIARVTTVNYGTVSRRLTSALSDSRPQRP
jgi:hypothetical protein